MVKRSTLAIQLTLAALLPSFLLWGAPRTLICNSGFAGIAASEHPNIFSASVNEAWPALWQSAEKLFDRNQQITGYSAHALHLIESETERSFDLFYSSVEDAAGRLQGVSCTVIETTIEQQAERERQGRLAAEERLRLAHDAGVIGTFEWIPATGHIIGSATYNAIWGFEPGACLQVDMLVDLVDEADRPLLGNAVGVKRLNPLAYAEYCFRKADTGEKRWLARRGEIVGDGVSAPQRFVGIVFDITERKMIEQALVKTELEVSERNGFIKLLLDSTAEGFYSIDRDGATTLCNRAFLRMDGSRFPVEYCVHPIWHEGRL
jgi:PAS domain-containing protein